VAAGLALAVFVLGYFLASSSDHGRLLVCGVIATVLGIVAVVAFQMDHASKS